MSTYTIILKKAIERVDSLDWRVLLAISRGARRLDIAKTEHITLNLEKNEYTHSGRTISLHEIIDGKENWLNGFTPFKRSHSTQDEIIRYLKALLLFSRVCERVGFQQQKIDSTSREIGEGKVTYHMVGFYSVSGPGKIEIRKDRGAPYKTFFFNSEDDILKEIVEFEKTHLTPESLSTMSPALKELLVKGEEE